MTQKILVIMPVIMPVISAKKVQLLGSLMKNRWQRTPDGEEHQMAEKGSWCFLCSHLAHVHGLRSCYSYLLITVH